MNHGVPHMSRSAFELENADNWPKIDWAPVVEIDSGERSTLGRGVVAYGRVIDTPCRR
jgi:hypothetical protein